MALKADIARAVRVVKKSGAQDTYLKFVDLLGRWHQVGLPVSNFGPELFSKGVISREVAVENSSNPSDFERALQFE